MIQFLKDWMSMSLAIVAFVGFMVGGVTLLLLIFAGLWKGLGVAGIVIGIVLLLGFLFTLADSR